MSTLKIVLLMILIATLPHIALSQTNAFAFKAGAAKSDITPTQLPRNSEGRKPGTLPYFALSAIF